LNPTWLRTGAFSSLSLYALFTACSSVGSLKSSNFFQGDASNLDAVASESFVALALKEAGHSFGDANTNPKQV
jgi:hypothetical protein